MDLRTNNNLYDNGVNDNRSYDDYSWIDQLGWKRKLPVIARQINNFMAYSRFCKHASEAEIWKLDKLWTKNGLTSAIEDMIIELNGKKFNAHVQKEQFIDSQLNKPVVNVELLEEQFQEEERWKNLSEKDRRLKTMELIGTPGCATPPIYAKDITSQLILEEKIGYDGIGYRIYDKLYNYYSVAVISPMRTGNDGITKTGKIIRRHHKADLYIPLKEALKEERRLYDQYLTRGRQGAAPGTTSVATSTNIPTQRTTTPNVNIDHVRKAMGLQSVNLNEELNGDIF